MFSISIITKTFNRLPLLLECVESVQHLHNEPYDADIQWEHVIYDDGSDDGTQDHFVNHAYAHTRYIRSDANRGISTAANAAISTCTSEYLFELDSDDVVPQRFLSNLYDTTQEYPHASWFIADFYRMNEDRKYILGDDYYGWNYPDCKAILHAIFSNTHFIQHNVVYKRCLWEQCGRYDETLTMAEDLDLFVRFLLADIMPIYVPYISHLHRFHARNASIGVTPGRHTQDIMRLVAKYHEKLTEKGITPYNLL